MWKKLRISPYSCAANVLLGAKIRTGRCIFCITCAILNVLPEPVTPNKVWYAKPDCKPLTSALIAVGWSPAGLKFEINSKFLGM